MEKEDQEFRVPFSQHGKYKATCITKKPYFLKGLLKFLQPVLNLESSFNLSGADYFPLQPRLITNGSSLVALYLGKGLGKDLGPLSI